MFTNSSKEAVLQFGWMCGFSTIQMIEDALELAGLTLTESEILADWASRDEEYLSRDFEQQRAIAKNELIIQGWHSAFTVKNLIDDAAAFHSVDLTEAEIKEVWERLDQEVRDTHFAIMFEPA